MYDTESDESNYPQKGQFSRSLAEPGDKVTPAEPDGTDILPWHFGSILQKTAGVWVGTAGYV